jgi:hypothetical protein
VDSAGRPGKVCDPNPGVYAAEKSDINIVLKKVPNKDPFPIGTAEVIEEMTMTNFPPMIKRLLGPWISI